MVAVVVAVVVQVEAAAPAAVAAAAVLVWVARCDARCRVASWAAVAERGNLLARGAERPWVN